MSGQIDMWDWRHKAALVTAAIALIGGGLALRSLAEQTHRDSPATQSALPAAATVPEDVSSQDVEMFGKTMSVWDDNGRRVIEYAGEFRLDFGRRRLSADNAIVWIDARQADGQTVKFFSVYLEGNARIVEGGGTVLTDKRHLVTFETTGRIWTDKDKVGQDNPQTSALYRRAKAFRDGAAEPDGLATQPEPPAAPAQIKAPISFHADQTTVEVRGPERVIFATGNVYISRADPFSKSEQYQPLKGKQFVELRADRAVVFLRESNVQELTVGGMAGPRFSGTIIGAYLEGAVSLSQGERSIKGDRLYYDFDRDRALVLDAVLFERQESREVPLVVWADQIRQLSMDWREKLTLTVTRNGRSMKVDFSLPPGASESASASELLNVEVAPLTAELAEQFGHAPGDRGVVVTDVIPGGQAARNGLLVGDLITRVQSTDVADVEQFNAAARLVERTQPSSIEMLASNARLTTSTMHTPQYSIHAEQMRLKFEQGPDGNDTIYYKLKNQTFDIRNVPLMWSPGSQGRFRQQPTALRTVRVGADGDFGPFIEAQWDLFKLLNMTEPAGFDVYLNTNFYGQRGPAVGVEGDYRRDNYYGYFLTNLVWDRGSDELGEERVPEEESDDAEGEDQFRARGRVLARHRHYLQNNWELTAELSFLSDRTFLEEWYEAEFDTDKEQETLLYLKKAWDNNAFTSTLKFRINSFLNQAEKLPEVKFYKLGEPIYNQRLAYFTENSAGIYRYAVDDERLDRTSSSALVRGDTRHEFQLKRRSGPVNIVPFATLRLTGWSAGSDSILTNEDDGLHLAEEERNGGGSSVRMFAAGGVNASTTFSRTYDNVESRLWDLHRLRHLIKPEANLFVAGMNTERDELLPLDPGVEGITGSTALNLALRQRWQTKRGGPGKWRSVDWMTLDLEATLFANDPTETLFEPEFTRPPSTRDFVFDDVFARGEYFFSRPENSLARSTFNWLYQWRLSDTTTFQWDGNLGEGGLDRNNFGVAIQRWPRWRMFFGTRYIAALDTNDVVFQTHYKINRKYDVMFSYAFDTIAGEMASTQVTVIRKMQRLYVGLTFDVSNTKDRQMVMLSIWPEGAPEVRMGTARFSDVGTTTSSTRRY